jgi:hypothetical protein
LFRLETCNTPLNVISRPTDEWSPPKSVTLASVYSPVGALLVTMLSHWLKIVPILPARPGPCSMALATTKPPVKAYQTSRLMRPSSFEVWTNQSGYVVQSFGSLEWRFWQPLKRSNDSRGAV